jgi:hypothetical protein
MGKKWAKNGQKMGPKIGENNSQFWALKAAFYPSTQKN